MLHPIPESTERARLLAVVELQQHLMDALCALPVDSTVSQSWLQNVWPAVPAEWIKRFWENSKGDRAGWIAAVAKASATDKQSLLDLVTEQLRFRDLYSSPPACRLTSHGWPAGAYSAAKNLLKSFYAPLFYKDEGFPETTGGLFHKDHFLAGFGPMRICPYTDNFIQDTKLDHFLPKDVFPMLSCHPDNLIPCSTDPNSGSHKGTLLPLDPASPDQTGAWFHPRWRLAKDTYRLHFPAAPAPQQRVDFVAILEADQARLDNMASMFGLCEFWGEFLDDEVQNVAGDVQGWLADDGIEPTTENVRNWVLKRARQEKLRIGQDGLAIVKSHFYAHIASTPSLLAQIVRTCTQGT